MDGVALGMAFNDVSDGRFFVSVKISHKMTIAVTVGSYLLVDFVGLATLSVKHAFDDPPLLISDGLTDQSPKIESIAEKHGAVYLSDDPKRSHHEGCLVAAMRAIAFAREHGCDVALKTNQRCFPIARSIWDKVQKIFEDPGIDLILPGRPRPESLVTSKDMFSKFPVLVDMIFMRASAFDPAWILDSYRYQCNQAKNPSGLYTELYWLSVMNSKCRGKTFIAPWLTEHTVTPHEYLRKTQNVPMDFIRHAQAMGMKSFQFPVLEWNQLRKGSYACIPR